MQRARREFCSKVKTAMVLNCGSSSVKYQLFENENSILRGSIENIGTSSCVHKRRTSSGESPYSTSACRISDYPSAINAAIESVMSMRDEIYCVGHRVVHGGPNLTGPTLISDSVLNEIRSCSRLAPLHNPSNVRGIELAREALQSVRQIACFDTAFHSHIPRKSYLYGIPISISNSQGIRRYGFHGLSYSYISSLVKDKRIIIAHLGSGCSAAALVNGVSIDTTMGFTPMEGLVMSTRAGSIDPGVVLHLARSLGGDIDKLSNILNKESGLLGLSGISSDMKTLLRIENDSSDSRSIFAHEAIEVFVNSVQKHIGQLLASLEFDVDSIVFTGGIGENSPIIRSRILRVFHSLGVRLDESFNQNIPADSVISGNSSTIKVMVIRTNEEQQIAKDAIRIASTICSI